MFQDSEFVVVGHTVGTAGGVLWTCETAPGGVTFST